MLMLSPHQLQLQLPIFSTFALRALGLLLLLSRQLPTSGTLVITPGRSNVYHDPLLHETLLEGRHSLLCWFPISGMINGIVWYQIHNHFCTRHVLTYLESKVGQMIGLYHATFTPSMSAISSMVVRSFLERALRASTNPNLKSSMLYLVVGTSFFLKAS